MSDVSDGVKILFRFYSDVLEEYTVETMWGDIIDIDKGLYKIDNIPFYAPLIASDDIVFAEYDEDEQMLTYRKTVEPSGNSTVWVIIMNDNTNKEDIRAMFKDMGCESEGINDKYFAMEIPEKVDYKLIKQKLQELEQKGIIEYSEPCLSYIHDYNK